MTISDPQLRRVQQTHPAPTGRRPHTAYRPVGFRILRWIDRLIPVVFCLGVSMQAMAHTTGESYVFIDVNETRIEGRVEILVDDLTSRLGHEIQAASVMEDIDRTAPEVRAYITDHLSFRTDGSDLQMVFSTNGVITVPTGSFAQYHFAIDADPMPTVLDVENRLLLEGNRLHRSLLLIGYNYMMDKDYGEEYTALLFSESNAEQPLDLQDIRGLLRPRDFVWQGILHIWIGIDHVLFLVALILPAVLLRQGSAWVPVPRFRQALWQIVKIVTAFTVAHSLTLSLAALNLVSLPPRFVESMIALSIVVIAVNNLYRRFDDSWWLIFIFGLFHGLGFASVMGHLPFRMTDLLKVILGFNVGVELGQIVIVSLVFPLLYALRTLGLYTTLVLRGGSAVVTAVAGYWFVTRALGL